MPPLAGIGVKALGHQIGSMVPEAISGGKNLLSKVGGDVTAITSPFSSVVGAPSVYSPKFSDWSQNIYGKAAGAGGALGGFGAIARFPTFPSLGDSRSSLPTAGSNQGLTAGGSAVTQLGGQWATLDQSNNEIVQAASKFGVPGNLLKAMINNESSGEWGRDGSRVTYLQERGDYILPFVGITKKAADAWGLNWQGMVGNKQAQIDGMATIISGLAKQYGGFDNAIKVYFGGEQALKGNWKDENGLPSDYYYSKAKANWTTFDQQGGGAANSAHGAQIVDLAKQFLGVKYVWGSLPGSEQDPWQTGWDCSAFVNWLDDKYGSNQLPAGSHYQYQNAVDTKQLFTDQSQLQAGDIVYIDTGWQGGAGAEMNRAGHVGMYIGNGQIINALNPQAGTVVSNLSDLGTFLGAQHMNWSSGVNGGGVNNVVGFDSSKPAWFNAIKYGYAA